VVAVGFLTELSTDIYKGATAALLNLYRRLRQLDTPSGRLEPLIVVVESEHCQVRFVIPEALSDQEFLSVFGTIAPLARQRVNQVEEAESSGHRIIEYELSPDREWVERFNEPAPK
jgi:hypothetical protein